MAEAMLAASKLSIRYVIGSDGEGKMQYKTKTYNNVKTTATTDALYMAAQAIIGLQNYSLDSIERIDSAFLSA